MYDILTNLRKEIGSNHYLQFRFTCIYIQETSVKLTYLLCEIISKQKV